MQDIKYEYIKKKHVKVILIYRISVCDFVKIE